MCSCHHQCYRHTVILIYTVLHTDSGAAQAVVTKADGERDRALLSSWLQGVLPWRQRWTLWRHSSQQLAVDLPADFLCHALSNLDKRQRQKLKSQPWERVSHQLICSSRLCYKLIPQFFTLLSCWETLQELQWLLMGKLLHTLNICCQRFLLPWAQTLEFSVFSSTAHSLRVMLIL